MGILNMTPDSFAGDGLGYDVEAAVERALAFQEQGADLVDVGGRSTRPPGRIYGAGAGPVSVGEELRRVLPVIERLKRVLAIPVSIDTFQAEVAQQAVAAGASMVNDVWGLKADAAVAKVAAEGGVPLVLAHNQVGYSYADLMAEVVASLRHSIEQALATGVPREHIIVDPGIGFGKTTEHSLELLRRLDEFREALGCFVLVGTSRKSHIGVVLGELAVEERLEGTAATMALAIAKGADIVRVHDVKEMVRVARMSDAIVRGWTPSESSS
ncbi:MAG: dihydropteroate synthase [Chloroflexi bacterium]|nr:dihydropteroate synthase [Chloroflexota bacterium]